jgi:hypothetical protein
VQIILYVELYVSVLNAFQLHLFAWFQSIVLGRLELELKPDVLGCMVFCSGMLCGVFNLGRGQSVSSLPWGASLCSRRPYRLQNLLLSPDGNVPAADSVASGSQLLVLPFRCS